MGANPGSRYYEMAAKEPVECRKVLNSKELSKKPMQPLKPYVDSSKGLNLKLRWKHLLLQLHSSCSEMCS